VNNKNVSKIEADEINILSRECTGRGRGGRGGRMYVKNVLRELDACLLNRKSGRRLHNILAYLSNRIDDILKTFVSRSAQKYIRYIVETYENRS
jgi:hypothetical protein